MSHHRCDLAADRVVKQFRLVGTAAGDPLIFARAVYQIAGLSGAIHAAEERSAWRKVTPSLTEYDYYLRGVAFYFRFTGDGNARA